MSVSESELFEISQVGDVTIIKLVDAARSSSEPPQLVDRVALSRFVNGVSGPLPSPSWAPFERDLLAFLDANKPAKIVLDFAGLETAGVISSAMNGMYARVRKRSDTCGSTWRLCGLTESTRTAYKCSSLHETFPLIHRDAEEALAAFRAR